LSAAALPSGLTGSFSSSRLLLSPGAKGTSQLGITASTSMPTGSYMINIQATSADSASVQGSTSATVVVATPVALTSSVTTDKTAYKTGETVRVSAVISADGKPKASTPVSFIMTTSAGKTTTASGTTDSTGKAVVSFKIGKRDPLGTYKISAQSGSGSSGTVATTQFTVQ
jgi:hypothetical protein